MQHLKEIYAKGNQRSLTAPKGSRLVPLERRMQKSPHSLNPRNGMLTEIHRNVGIQTKPETTAHSDWSEPQDGLLFRMKQRH